MAKKSKPSRTRDASTISREAGLGTPKLTHIYNPYNITPQPAVLYHDRRAFRPDKTTRPPTSLPPRLARIVTTVINFRRKKRSLHAKVSSLSPLYHLKKPIRERLGFAGSRRLEICLRRAARREVMFAKKKAGKSGQRKAVRNFWSAISCR